MFGRRRSISTPIILAAVSVGLSIALLVGWTVLVVGNMGQDGEQTWLLVMGIIAFATIMGVLITFAVSLMFEILEHGRQTRFIDSVTHELKSPLASIKLAAETMETRSP